MIAITAHAGCQQTKAGSLDDVRLGIALGADVMEVDVQMQNGVAVLSHNSVDDGVVYQTFASAVALIAQTPAMQINCDIKNPLVPSLVQGDLKAVLQWPVCGITTHQVALALALRGKL